MSQSSLTFFCVCIFHVRIYSFKRWSLIATWYPTIYTHHTLTIPYCGKLRSVPSFVIIISAIVKFLCTSLCTSLVVFTGKNPKKECWVKDSVVFSYYFLFVCSILNFIFLFIILIFSFPVFFLLFSTLQYWFFLFIYLFKWRFKKLQLHF